MLKSPIFQLYKSHCSSSSLPFSVWFSSDGHFITSPTDVAYRFYLYFSASKLRDNDLPASDFPGGYHVILTDIFVEVSDMQAYIHSS